MSLSAKPMRLVAALLATAAPLVVGLWFWLHEAAEKRVRAGHAKAYTYQRLQMFALAFGNTLHESWLALPPNAKPGATISLSGGALTNLLISYGESSGIKFEPTFQDSWKTPVRTTFVFEGYWTNLGTDVRALVRVRAQSFGPNRRDEGGQGDDLVFEQTFTFGNSWVTNVVDTTLSLREECVRFER